MSSGPPRDSDGERTSREVERRPASEPGTPEPVQSAPPSGPLRLIGSGGIPSLPPTPAFTADLPLFEDEAAALASVDGRRTSRLLHEIAHGHERAGLLREAAKTYTRALTADPSFQGNAWALRRIFAAHGFWENIVRLVDAEVRFAPIPRAEDRADLLVEKGRILEDRLGRAEDALGAYRAALALAPDHAAALLSVLLVTAKLGAREEGEGALAALLGRATEPRARAALALALSRSQRGAYGNDGEPDRLRRAAETLFRALSSGAEIGPLLEELDRLSLAAGPGADLRPRVLDAFDSRFSRERALNRRDIAFMTALYREKARALLRRGARDAAVSVLERALAIAPQHPLVIADYLDAADEAGRPDAFATFLAEREASLAPDRLDEVRLRRAEAAARAGALGEAIGALGSIARDGEHGALAALARARVLARLGDADGLAELFASEAELALGSGDPGEAAHLFVRAAELRRVHLADASGAEALYRRARGALPEDEGAAAGLALVLADRGRWEELATFFEEELARAGDDERRRALRGSLVVLYADVLHRPDRAMAYAVAPGAGEGGVEAHDVAQELRLVDLAGRARAHAPEAGADAGRALERVAEALGDEPVAAPLRVLAGRLHLQAGAADRARVAFDAAFRVDPTAGAGAALDALAAGPTDVEARLDRLGLELRATEESGRDEAARALRFRLAFVAAEARRWSAALEALAPLRARRDEAAVAWSLELARDAADPAAELRLLRDAVAQGADEAEPIPDPRTAGERALALGEALEAQGDLEGADAAFGRALAVLSTPDQADTAARLFAVLGRLRIATKQRDSAALLRHTQALAVGLEGPEQEEVGREVALIAFAIGISPEEGGAPGGADALLRWLTAARSGDAAARVEALAGAASALGAAPSAAELWALVGVRRIALGAPGAEEALERAAELGGGPEVAVAADLLPGPLPPALAALRRARAERLLALPEGTAVAEALLVEEARDAERAGRLRAAADAYARILVEHPESLEAIEGLRRVSEAAGDRAAQAAALERLGDLLRAPRRAAERYAEAALLLEEQGQPDAAARLYEKLLERVPDDEEAYHRLHDILAARPAPAGLLSLLSHKLQHATEPAIRAALYAERAIVRLARLEDRDGAIADHRRVLTLDPNRLDSLLALARLARDAGRPERAATFLARALAAAPTEEAPAIRFELAAAHEEAGHADEAIAVLTKVIDATPDDAAARERLVALLARRGQTPRALEQLRALAALTDDRTRKAAVFRRMGDLERDARGDLSDAVAYYRAAVELDPLGEAYVELCALAPARARLSAIDEQALDRVLADLRRALDEDPLDVPRLERVAALARLRGRATLADAAGQLLTTLGHGAGRGRARDLGRPLAPARLAALGSVSGDEKPGLLVEVGGYVAEAMARLEGLDAAALGATRTAKVLPGSEPRLRWVEAAGLALGVPELALYVGGSEELRVFAFDLPEPSLLVGRGVLGGDPASRFRVGRALELLRRRTTAVDRASVEELAPHWRAVSWLAGAGRGEGEPGDVRALAKALAKGLSRRDLKALETYRARFEQEALDVEGWRASVLRAANRVGLLVAGDLGAALRALTGGGPVLEPEALRRPSCLELIRFALGDQHAALRQEAGLGDA